MNILVYYVRSILEYQRRTTFSDAVQVKNAYQVICLTETWLTESIGDAALFLTYYVIHRNDRPSDKGLTKHGGVLIAVNRNIPSSQINSAFQDCYYPHIPEQADYNKLHLQRSFKQYLHMGHLRSNRTPKIPEE